MSESRQHSSDPTVEQIAAMISVLGDDRGPLQRSAHQRLLTWGELAIDQLRVGAEADHMPTRARCRALLRTIEVRSAVEQMGRLRLDGVGQASAQVLLEGAVLAARMMRTFVPEISELASQLRREAAVLRRACAGRSLSVCAKLLVERLHHGLGLHGCDHEQLDLEQYLLPNELFEDGDLGRGLIDRLLIDRVLATREGAPIALSLIYLLVARWAGLSATGVALPDHFLVRLHGPRPLLLDPFHGGRLVTKSDCVRYLRRSGYERPRDHLRDLNDRDVLVHYLHTLRAGGLRRSPVADAGLTDALDLLQID